MKEIALLATLWLLCPACGFSQDTAFRLLKTMSYPVSDFTINLTDELFVVGKDNLLRKYDANGDSVGVFNDVKRYGKLSYVKAENPWNVVLFYQNFQTVVFLDKYLKNIGSINLTSKNIYNVKAVTTSYDNGLWLFDGREYKIKKIDDNGNVQMASVDLRQLFDKAPDPVWINDQDGLLYLYDPLMGFFIFDYYGAFKVKLSFLNLESVHVIHKDIIGFDNQYMYRYTPPIPDVTPSLLPPELTNAAMINISPQKIYVLKNEELKIYKR